MTPFYIGSGAKWFSGAEFVSGVPLMGLGADGHGSAYTFALGSALAGLNAHEIYEWRSVAGNALINAGFDGFRELYISGADPVQWDINQLKSEQAVLQAVHHKFRYFLLEIRKM